MTAYGWTVLGAWLLVAAVTVAAHLFGREARAAPSRAARRTDPTRWRIGVAVSITGPIAGFLVGLATAALTGAWILAALITLLAVVAIAVVGLFLAPD
ncbi:hypothetical protein [Cumulibacter manganitolerans]|uniref:hypothetical protein n=1 Tax=Cumulibacter manganitolerans TaxID=1884992 RepID=UPI0012972C28|nr:hypothetical protein [Cumulibacter manganitolerans]